MNRTKQPSQFLPEHEVDRKQLSVDLPVNSHSPYHEKIPSGYDPIGEIHLRGRASRGFAGGRIPWWVLFSSWFMLGGLIFLVLIPIITLAAFELLPFLVLLILPLLIVIRGTKAKLTMRRYRNEGRSSY